MMVPPIGSLSAGDVRSFVKLHLDSAREKRERLINGNWLYEVEGKARPMVVLAAPQIRNGRRWYLVVPLHSKPSRDCIPLANFLGPTKQSFADLTDGCPLLPENLLASPREHPADKLDKQCFDNLLLIVSRRARPFG